MIAVETPPQAAEYPTWPAGSTISPPMIAVSPPRAQAAEYPHDRLAPRYPPFTTRIVCCAMLSSSSVGMTNTRMADAGVATSPRLPPTAAPLRDSSTSIPMGCAQAGQGRAGQGRAGQADSQADMDTQAGRQAGVGQAGRQAGRQEGRQVGQIWTEADMDMQAGRQLGS